MVIGGFPPASSAVISFSRGVMLGYGNRGEIYSDYALTHSEQMEIVAVVDSLGVRRNIAANKFKLPNEMLFDSLENFFAQTCNAISL